MICGNYAESGGKDSDESLYAGGSDAISIRTITKYAAENDWEGMVLDIKTAFLNALVQEKTGKGEAEKVLLMKPPAILVSLGLCRRDDYWAVTKALYGLRQSPRRWSVFRDQNMRTMEWKRGSDLFWLEQTVSDPNVWKILKGKGRDDERGELTGLMAIYVDDILAYTDKLTQQELYKVIREKWETSEPEFVTLGGKVRFCGMEISRTERGYHLGQAAYTQELLNRYGDGGYGSVIPISKI